MRKYGVVLAGGKSTRMGKDKSLLDLNGKPVIEHAVNQLQRFTDGVSVITNNPDAYRFLDVELYSDRYTEMGPLAGIESALFHTDADIYICAACDMPFADSAVYKLMLESLGGADAVVPIFEERMHPLSGVYTKTVLPAIQRQLDKDNRKVRNVFDLVNVNYVDDFGNIPEAVLAKHFFNMNYPEQYEAAKQL